MSHPEPCPHRVAGVELPECDVFKLRRAVNGLMRIEFRGATSLHINDRSAKELQLVIGAIPGIDQDDIVIPKHMTPSGLLTFLNRTPFAVRYWECGHCDISHECPTPGQRSRFF